MKYKISSSKKDSLPFNLSIEFESDEEVLNTFFQNNSYYYPELLYSVVNSDGFVTEFSSYIPYAVLDSEDFVNNQGFEPDEIKIRVYFGETILLSSIFNLLLYEYSVHLLEVYGSDHQLQDVYSKWLEKQTAKEYYNREYYLKFNPNWALAMEEGIKKLKEKMQL